MDASNTADRKCVNLLKVLLRDAGTRCESQQLTVELSATAEIKLQLCVIGVRAGQFVQLVPAPHLHGIIMSNTVQYNFALRPLTE